LNVTELFGDGSGGNVFLLAAGAKEEAEEDGEMEGSSGLVVLLECLLAVVCGRCALRFVAENAATVLGRGGLCGNVKA
jgi:hypothetical protein